MFNNFRLLASFEFCNLHLLYTLSSELLYVHIIIFLHTELSQVFSRYILLWNTSQPSPFQSFYYTRDSLRFPQLRFSIFSFLWSAIHVIFPLHKVLSLVFLRYILLWDISFRLPFKNFCYTQWQILFTAIFF